MFLLINASRSVLKTQLLFPKKLRRDDGKKSNSIKTTFDVGLLLKWKLNS